MLFASPTWPRSILVFSLVGLALAMSACDQLGESAVDAELKRIKSLKGFAVLEQTRDKAEIAAQGKKLWIAASKGFCIAPDSIEVSRRGIVAVIADCVDGEIVVTTAETGATIELPPSFPGVVTVSVTGKRGLRETSAITSVAALETFLESKDGRRLLGRTQQSKTIEVRDMRRIGDALYVHVHDTEGDALGIFAPDFWRAFLPIRDRLVLVTVNSFAARPLDDEDMMGFLATQVVRLHEANGSRPSSEELAIAAAVDGQFESSSGPVSLAELELDDGTAPKKAPRPVFRPKAALGSIESETEDASRHVARPSSRWAPVRAPVAPKRPS
ncbi:MAG: hypothetical protein AAGC81_06520 [Pseudomonadota bacterium]